MNCYYGFSFLAGCLGVVYVWPACISALLFIAITIIPIFVGIYVALYVHVVLSSPHKTGDGVEKANNELDAIRTKFYDFQGDAGLTKSPSNYRPIIYGRTVDNLLQQLLDYALRDFVLYWIKDYAFDAALIVDNFKEDVWGAIQNFQDRLNRVDQAKLIAVDMISKITLHFEKLRVAHIQANETSKQPQFSVYPHIMSEESELRYLRKVSELLVMLLFPRSYSLSPVKYLMREIIACKLLKPMIETLTEPDYINQKIIEYIESQQAAAAMHRRSYEYANSFEDFLRLIEKTTDIEVLKSMRYNIVTELMQVTTLQNLKRAKGVDPDEEKGARKIKQYVQQLTFAKSQCEKRLAFLGWDGGFSLEESAKTLPLASILDNVLGRKYLSLFLETVASQGLVGYWTAVEELKTAVRSNWHQLGAEIFYTYIRSPTAEIKVDKSVRKRMEAFLLGDRGPEVFYEVQNTVVETLEEKYYQSFVMSVYYNQLIEALTNEEASADHDGARGSLEERQQSADSNDSNGGYVGDHSNYSRRKLDQLQERLNNKMQALQALRASLKPESRVLSILEKEVEWLQGEQRQLEAHLARTDTWGENLGKWRANVQSAEIPDDKEIPHFVIVVHMVEAEVDSGEDSISTGWVVCRTLTQFQELHRKLRPLCSTVKNLELPSQTFKFLFGKTDKNGLDKAKAQIQKYLEFILEDDKLNQSEAIYAFLSPSSEHLKRSSPSPKKSLFSFSTLFKSGSGDQPRTESLALLRESEEEDISHCLDDATDKSGSSGKLLDDGKDTIAEPMYALMSEIFDMRGIFKFFRKTLISFVQITYGRTINRQIRDTVSWAFSETMLHYYITLFMKSWWPGGELGPKAEPRSEKTKIETVLLARQQFVSNVPEVLVTLVGTQTARRGAVKIFDTVQVSMMNKQLFYTLFETFMTAVFPELKTQH